MENLDTIVALATPSGESALALLRVSGPLVPVLAETCLQPPPRWARRACLSWYRSVDEQSLDRLIAVFYHGNASYTGEPLLEITPHGNPFLVRKIIDDLLQRGCRLAEPGEFTRRSFLSGKMDLCQAEAVLDVIRARSDAALRAAQRQLCGHLGKVIQELVDALLHITAQVEAYIDFPEEDLPPENQEGPAQALQAVSAKMERLLATAEFSSMLKEGARIVLVGPPNAGKSSLLNALLGEERAIVSEEPGTTRDYLEASFLLGPYLVRLVDTAGLRPNPGRIELLGMAKTKEQMKYADLLLWVLDSSAPLPESLISEAVPPDIPGLVLENKADLPQSVAVSSFRPDLLHIRVSALTGLGLPEVRSRLRSYLDQVAESHEDASILVGARHAEALREAKTAVTAALGKMQQRLPAELIASDLCLAREALGRITGKIDHERVLDVLFRQFCIGK